MTTSVIGRTTETVPVSASAGRCYSRELRSQGAQRACRLRDRHARLQSRDHIQFVARRLLKRRVARQRGPRFDRHPGIDAAWVFDIGRHHAHDHEPLIGDREASADDVDGATVASLPEAVRQDEHTLGASPVVGPTQCPPQERTHSENIEKVTRDAGGVDVLGGRPLDDLSL